MTMISAWWTSRSIMAAATVSSPKTSPHPLKGLLLVTIREARMSRAEMSWKNGFAAAIGVIFAKCRVDDLRRDHDQRYLLTLGFWSYTLGVEFKHLSMGMWARLSSMREAIAFHVKPPNRQLLVGDLLPFDDDAQECFLTKVGEARSYLEFGSGASTLHVARTGKPLISIESDKLFLNAVRERLAGLEPDGPVSSGATLLHADIGPTGPWGKPVLPSLARPRKWSNYPQHPWRVFGEEYYADTILVDGRFRVACALAVILYQRDKPWTMLVDDYAERPHYRVIEQYAELVNMHGRMAEFKPMSGTEREGVSEALRTFSGDWR